MVSQIANLRYELLSRKPVIGWESNRA